MKKILLSVLTLSLFTAISCFKIEPEPNLALVRFHNLLDQDILNATYGFSPTLVSQLGDLPAGKKSDYIPFDYFNTGNGLPVGIMIGTIDKNTFLASSSFFCGNGVDFRALDAGYYTIEITNTGFGGSDSYRLKFAE